MFKYTFCGILLLLVFSSDQASAFSPTPTSGAGFQPNVGQMDARVAFWAHRDGIDLFVTTKGELVHRLHGNDDRDWVLIERLEHAQALHPQAVSPEQTQITLLDHENNRSAHNHPPD